MFLLVEKELCDMCKLNRLYGVCQKYHDHDRESRIGCRNYIPMDFYYREGELYPKCGYLYSGKTYQFCTLNNDEIAKMVKNSEVKKLLIECASKTGLLTKELYDNLYKLIKDMLHKSRKISYSGMSNNEIYARDYPDAYKKCLDENINVIIGKFFAYIQRMEQCGTTWWDEFVKRLKNNQDMYRPNITVTYFDHNIRIKQDLVFDTKPIRFYSNKIAFKHGWEDSDNKVECFIEVFEKQISSIEMSKADWVTSIRKYTLTFKNKQKMYFDMY
jgi:hypothetical protein